MNRRLAILLPAAMAVLGLTACNSTTTGLGTPESTPTTTSQQSGDGGQTTSDGGSTGGGSPLASVDPCSLLSSSVLNQYGLSKTASGPGTGARPCNWQKPVDINGKNGLTVEIDVRDTQGLNDINANGFTITPDNVGSHQGRLAKLNAGGSCFVAIGVGDSSRVDVGVAAGTDTTQACQVANDLAKDVEPQLPAGG